MQPINYQIDVGNPFQSALQGMQTRANYDQMLAQREAAASQQAYRQTMQADFAALAKDPNPTAQSYISALTKYPEIAEKFKTVWEPLGEVERKNKVASATQVLAALKSGNGQVAADLLKEQAAAQRNSGQEGLARANEKLAEMALSNPKAVIDTGSLLLAEALGPKEFINAYSSMGKLPGEIQKTEIEVANLPTKLQLEQQSTFEDIESKRLKRQLDVLDAQIKRADSDVKREELQLKRDEKAAELGQKKAETQAVAQNTLTSVSQQLDTVDKVLSSDLMKPGFNANWTGPGSLAYKINKNLPTSTEAKDLENLVGTLRSQQFLSNLTQLKAQGGTLGALSEKEGAQLEKALASLDTGQSAEAFRGAVNTIKKSLENIQRQIVAQGKLPTSDTGAGGAFVMQHPKYGVVTESTVNKMLATKPGLTRAQAIEFLKSTGAQ